MVHLDNQTTMEHTTFQIKIIEMTIWSVPQRVSAWTLSIHVVHAKLHHACDVYHGRNNLAAVLVKTHQDCGGHDKVDERATENEAILKSSN